MQNPGQWVWKSEPEVKASCRHMHIGYFTTEYPHISHTFIRREIAGLEELDYSIERFAVKSGEADVDQADVEEQEKTTYLLEQSPAETARLLLKGLFLANFSFFRALAQVWELSRVSGRGLFRHFAYLAEALMLRALCKERAVPHLHVHFGTNSAAVALLAYQMGGPSYSLTIHGPLEFDHPYGESLARKIESASFVAAISSFGRSQLYRWLPKDSWDKVRVVPCTVDDEWFECAYPVDPSSNRLVSIGRLDMQKGQLVLIEAFADAVAAGLQSNLTIVGDGPIRPALEARIRERGLTDRVELAGWCPAREVRQHLLEAKALVLPSFAEGLPVVIMEAMASMRPVISSRIAGIPELVRDGIEGWLVTPADRDELVEALLSIEKIDPVELTAMGKAAQLRIRERHHTNVATLRLDELFREHI